MEWEKSFGNDTKIHAVIEATNGYLIAAGETNAKTSGGSDGLLLIADHSTGQVVAELRYGGNKDDAFYAVAQTFDGRFLLAGSTASAGKGGDDAWLLLVDDTGHKIWETTFGTTGRDKCQKILLLPDGAVLLAGQQNGQKNGDLWLAKVVGQQILWEKNIGASEFETLGEYWHWLPTAALCFLAIPVKKPKKAVAMFTWPKQTPVALMSCGKNGLVKAAGKKRST